MPGNCCWPRTVWLTQAASALGLVTPGAALYPGTLAVYIGMVCDYLPFLVLPLYASVEKLDWRLAEAAADLGPMVHGCCGTPCYRSWCRD